MITETDELTPDELDRAWGGIDQSTVGGQLTNAFINVVTCSPIGGFVQAEKSLMEGFHDLYKALK